MSIQPQTYYVNSEHDLNCPISHERMEHPVRTRCNHFFESVNINQWLVDGHNCPVCRTPLTDRDIEVVRLSYRPEVTTTVDRTNNAAASVLPSIPSSALPITQLPVIPVIPVLPVIEVARSLEDLRIEARATSVRNLEASQSSNPGRVRSRILHKLHGHNRAANHKRIK